MQLSNRKVIWLGNFLLEDYIQIVMTAQVGCLQKLAIEIVVQLGTDLDNKRSVLQCWCA